MRALVGKEVGPDGEIQAAGKASKWALAGVHAAMAFQGHGGEKAFATQLTREPSLFLMAEAVLD